MLGRESLSTPSLFKIEPKIKELGKDHQLPRSASDNTIDYFTADHSKDLVAT
jgi:hypothetical protein